jgi:hypothetical protein
MSNELDFSLPEKKFSQRKSLQEASIALQVDGMSTELRNSLWNVLVLYIFRPYIDGVEAFNGRAIDSYFDYLTIHFFKTALDQELILYRMDKVNRLYQEFCELEWNKIYDFLEVTLSYFQSPDFMSTFNLVLRKEMSGYRFIGALATEITSEQEVELLQEVLDDRDFPSVSIHLRNSLALMSNRENPDYRNSIKESISAVESLAKSITGKEKATLGTALKELEKTNKLHPALKESFLKLYGYTSDEGGIRHAMLEEPDLTADDAKYILLSCTSFINYLKSKLA